MTPLRVLDSQHPVVLVDADTMDHSAFQKRSESGGLWGKRSTSGMWGKRGVGEPWGKRSILEEEPLIVIAEGQVEELPLYEKRADLSIPQKQWGKRGEFVVAPYGWGG